MDKIQFGEGAKSNVFLLAIAFGGYFVFALTLFLFGDAMLPPQIDCYPPARCGLKPYEPQVFLVLVPGAVVALLGIAQLRLIRRSTSPVNRKILRWSFCLHALASVSICLLPTVSKSESLAALVVEAITLMGGLLGGFTLSLVNIIWSLARRQPAVV